MFTTTLAQEGHIVVVTVTYRLGAFGYLHDEANGMVNLGLKDQIMALRWVQRYILLSEETLHASLLPSNQPADIR